MIVSFSRWVRRRHGNALALGLAVAIAALLAAIPSVMARAEKTAENGIKGRTVIVGVPVHWPPQYSLDKNGRPTGFAIDVIEGIARQAGLKLDYRVYPNFRDVVKGWERREIDMIPNSGITPAREKDSLFTVPIETFVVSTFVRRGLSDILSPHALSGRRVSVVSRNIGHSLLKRRSDVNIVVHPDIQKALFDLLSGDSDALVFPKPVLLQVARSIGVEGKIEALEPPLKELKRAIRVQKHETVLHAILNKAVAKFRHTPEYVAIYQKWYGAPTPFWTVRRLLVIGGGLLLISLLAMIWWRYRSMVRLNLRLQESLAERGRVEGDLSRAQAQLVDAIESISEGFVLYDANERLVICNDKYKQLHPIAAPKMVPGASFTEIVRTAVEDGQHPTAIGREAEWLQERLAEFRNPGETKEHQMFDGRWLRYSEHRTRDGGTVGIRSDITQLKAIEDALSKSEARFRDFATSASDWFWEMDENLRFSYFSERFVEVTGVLESQLLGKTRQETGIPGVDEEAWRHHLADLDAHRPFRNFVHPRTTAGGEVLWLSISGTPVFDNSGVFQGYRGTGFDVTEKHRTEYLLRESEQRFKALMDHVPAALFLKDHEARYLLINKQFQEWFGVDPDNVIGKNAHDLYPPERAERYAESDRKILGNWQVTSDEVVIPTPAGDERNYTLTKFPIFDGGEPMGFGGVMIDTTQRTRSEAALRQSENRADMANRAKSEFLANMSHELRTPLNAIIGFSEIIKSGFLGKISGTKTLEYANDIYMSGLHLLDLINDILDLSKIELGSEEPNDAHINVRQLVDAVLVLMKERAGTARVHLQTVFQNDLPLLRADERKLKQILSNLLSNSIKFTHAGGRVALDVQCGPDGSYVFEVSDTGIGIAPEHMDKALQPFGQIDSDLNRKFTGTGLGLPLARELVEMHGGSLSLESTPDVGTTVTVRFPAERMVQADQDQVSS